MAIFISNGTIQSVYISRFYFWFPPHSRRAIFIIFAFTFAVVFATLPQSHFHYPSEISFACCILISELKLKLKLKKIKSRRDSNPGRPGTMRTPYLQTSATSPSFRSLPFYSTKHTKSNSNNRLNGTFIFKCWYPFRIQF